MDNRRIGDILLDDGVVAADDVAAAAKFQSRVGGLFGQALLRVGALSEEVLLAALARQLDLPVLGPADLPEDPSAYRRSVEAVGLAPDFLLQHDAVIWFGTSAGDTHTGTPSPSGEGGRRPGEG